MSDQIGNPVMQAVESGPLAYFVRRWRRQIPLSLLFWRDMIVVGSAINLAMAFAGLVALGFKVVDPAAAMLIYLAPLPYNFFLAGAVWRTAELAAPTQAGTARIGAILWLVAALIV
ncbi:MAG: hypothetical protein NTV73_16990 [Hyphomicrobiales bacterium]|nr:hypothetical protein [Hyphomicrobiales bacterium]